VKGKNSDPARHMVGLMTDDVQADYQRLKSKGVEFIEEPTNYDQITIATSGTLKEISFSSFRWRRRMAYNEKLAERTRLSLATIRPNQRKMFGGLAFMLNRNMFCGITGMT
jgi:hypothetical protein